MAIYDVCLQLSSGELYFFDIEAEDMEQAEYIAWVQAQSDLNSYKLGSIHAR